MGKGFFSFSFVPKLIFGREEDNGSFHEDILAMVSFKNGSVIIVQHPHSAFEKIHVCGYRVSFLIEQEVESFKNLLVKVQDGVNVVAEADFTDDCCIAYCQNVQVDPSHRRKGIATAIYVFAEKVLGKPLVNFWGNDPKQSPEGRALWAQPNRPFGNSSKLE